MMQCTPLASTRLVPVCLFRASSPWFFSPVTPASFHKVKQTPTVTLAWPIRVQCTVRKLTLNPTSFLGVFWPYNHTGQCKRTGGCYNELVVAFYSTGCGVKGKKNLYLLTLLFIYKLAFILFVMTPGAQTTGNIAVYGSAKQLVI